MPLVTFTGRQKVLAIFWAAVILLGTGVFLHARRLERSAGRRDTFQHVRTILVRRLGAPVEAVRRDAQLDGLGAQTADRMELSQAIQDEFEVEVPQEEARAWVTVGDVVAAVDRRLARRDR